MARLLCALAVVGVGMMGASAREVVNFDFGWRHELGNGVPPPPPGPPRTCAAVENGSNWVHEPALPLSLSPPSSTQPPPSTFLSSTTTTPTDPTTRSLFHHRAPEVTW